MSSDDGEPNTAPAKPDDFATSGDGLRRLHYLLTEAVQENRLLGNEWVESLLLDRASGFGKHDLPRIVAAAFVAAGPEGVKRLRHLLDRMPGHIYPLGAVEVLWKATAGHHLPTGPMLGEYEPAYALSIDAREAARLTLNDLVAEAQWKPKLFAPILGLLHQHFWTAESRGLSNSEFTGYFLEAVRDSSILLTTSLIDEFRELVAHNAVEERFQMFLKAHPVFIDPLAAETIAKHRLGSDYITDYVIRRHDSRYVVVEIERPKDAIFTSSGNFTARFTHAVGQVLDFQGWVNVNTSYAQQRLPSIENPHGMLIMGRRSDLNAANEGRLRRWNANSRTIEILTFDDLIVRAENLLYSLRGRAR